MYSTRHDSTLCRAASRLAKHTSDLPPLNETFPLGGNYNPSIPATPWDHGCLVGLAQYIEQGSVYNSFNVGLRYPDLANTTVLQTKIATLNCPSDPSVLTFPVSASTTYGWAASGITIARTSYMANAGTWNSPAVGDNPYTDPSYSQMIANANGVIYLYSSTRIAAITDGTSNTFLFGEGMYGRLGVNDQSGCRWWMAGNFGDSMLNAMYPPNVQLPNNAIDVDDNKSGAYNIYRVAASSQHPGGVSWAFADGSVQFIKNSIDSWPLDPTTYAPIGGTKTNISPPYGIFSINPGAKVGVYQALATRAGGEVISADAF